VIQICNEHRTDSMLKSTSRVEPSDRQSASAPTLRMLFESEESPLLRYAFSLTGRRVVAEEIVQDVFLQLHKHWETVEAPKAWLVRSVRNRAFTYIRTKQREPLSVEANHSATVATDDSSPDQAIVQMETAGEIRQALMELEENDRQLVKLKYFENLSYSEMSAKTGLSVSNVGYRLHHILKVLAGKLKPQGIDE
jgi:RNA polymerase sigma factor (sigma-70 family)